MNKTHHLGAVAEFVVQQPSSPALFVAVPNGRRKTVAVVMAIVMGLAEANDQDWQQQG
jgi:hypothetical protein